MFKESLIASAIVAAGIAEAHLRLCAHLSSAAFTEGQRRASASVKPGLLGTELVFVCTESGMRPYYGGRRAGATECSVDTVQGRSFADLLDHPQQAFRDCAYSRFYSADTVITEQFAYTSYGDGNDG